jgi:hypothetical protein
VLPPLNISAERQLDDAAIGRSKVIGQLSGLTSHPPFQGERLFMAQSV